MHDHIAANAVDVDSVVEAAALDLETAAKFGAVDVQGRAGLARLVEINARLVEVLEVNPLAPAVVAERAHLVGAHLGHIADRTGRKGGLQCVGGLETDRGQVLDDVLAITIEQHGFPMLRIEGDRDVEPVDPLGDFDQLAENFTALRARRIRMRHIFPVQRQAEVGGKAQQLFARGDHRFAPEHGIGLERRLHFVQADPGRERDKPGCRARQRCQLVEQRLGGILVGETHVVLDGVVQHAARVVGGIAERRDQHRGQVARGAGQRNFRRVEACIALAQIGAVQAQCRAGALAQVIDHLVEQAAAAVDGHRRHKGRQVVRLRHHDARVLGRIVDGERHHARAVAHLVERHAVDFANLDVLVERIPGHVVAFDGRVEQVGIFGEALDDFPRFAADDDGVAARAALDDQFADGAHIGAVQVDRVVAAAHQQLQAFDIEQFLQLDAGAVNALHGLAGGRIDLGVDVEGVAQDGADNADGVKTGAAVDGDVGVFHVHQRIDVHFARVDANVGAKVAVSAKGAADLGHLGIDIDQRAFGVEREQGLDQEGIVAIVAEQVDVGLVVVDLEVVVVRAAVEAGAVEGRALGDLLDDGDDLAFHHDVFGFQHGADVELVVAFIAEYVDLGGGTVGDDLVGAFAAKYADLLDRAVVDDLEVQAGAQRGGLDPEQRFFVTAVLGLVAAAVGVEVGDDQAIAMLAKTCPARIGERMVGVLRAVVHGVELNGVVADAALEDQGIDAARARVVDVEVLLAARHHGQFQHVAVAAFVAVQDAAVGPVEYFEAVGAGAAVQLGRLEDIGKHFLFVAELAVQSRVVNAQRGIRQPEIGIPHFDQGVEIARGIEVGAAVGRLEELVDAGPAGQAVGTRAADDDVRQRLEVGADDDVVAAAAVEDQFGDNRLLDCGGVDLVGAGQGIEAHVVAAFEPEHIDHHVA